MSKKIFKKKKKKKKFQNSKNKKKKIYGVINKRIYGTFKI